MRGLLLSRRLGSGFLLGFLLGLRRRLGSRFLGGELSLILLASLVRLRKRIHSARNLGVGLRLLRFQLLAGSIQLVACRDEPVDGGVVVGDHGVKILNGRDDLVETLARQQELDDAHRIGAQLVHGAQRLRGRLALPGELALDRGHALLVGGNLILKLVRTRNGVVEGRAAGVYLRLELIERGRLRRHRRTAKPRRHGRRGKRGNHEQAGLLYPWANH